MEINEQHFVQLTFLREGNYDEVIVVRDLFKKLNEKVKNIGYKKEFNKAEREIITKINETLNNSEVT